MHYSRTILMELIGAGSDARLSSSVVRGRVGVAVYSRTVGLGNRGGGGGRNGRNGVGDGGSNN